MVLQLLKKLAINKTLGGTKECHRSQQCDDFPEELPRSSCLLCFTRQRFGLFIVLNRKPTAVIPTEFVALSSAFDGTLL